MKAILLTSSALAGFVTLGTTALAQQAPTVPAPVARPVLQAPGEASKLGVPYKKYLLDHYAGDQQALAVVHLFARRQRGGAIWLLSGGVTTTLLVTQAGTHSSGSGSYTITVSPLGYVIWGGLPLFIGARKLIRFNNDKLYEALQMHDLTNHFPAYVESKLRGRDYR